MGRENAGGSGVADGTERVLAMAEDPEVLDALLRLAAAAGVEVHRAVDVADARRHWTRAPLALLDPAAVRHCLAGDLPARDRLVVVFPGEPGESLAEQAVQLGAEHLASLPEAEAWLVGMMADAVDPPPAAEPGRVLAVVGGRGGAGASVLCAAVAVAAAREGERTLLVDCDPLGGGLDLVLGAEEITGLRWPDITVTDGRVPANALHAAIPAPAVDRVAGELGLLSCARAPKGPTPQAVRAVLEAGRRGGETVVCDLPRYPTRAAEEVLTDADLTVLVVPADVRSCAAAGRVAAVLADQARRVALVVRGPAPGGIAPPDVAEALGLPLLTAMDAQRGLATNLDRGRPPGTGRGPLAAAARAVLSALRSPVLRPPRPRDPAPVAMLEALWRRS